METSSARLSRRDIALLAIIALIVLLPGTIGVSFVDRDEGWYAQVIREMRSTGDWLVPHYLGKPWLGKPPLMYWLSGLSTVLFGFGEWQARLVSVIPTAINTVLVGILGARLRGRQVGWWAALVFLTFGVVTVIGKLLLSDALVLTFILLAVLLQWQMVTEGVTHGRAAAHGVVVGLGLLAKGPVILIFAGSFALAMLVVYRRQWRAWLGNWRWWAWGSLAIFVAAPWYIYIYYAAHDTFVRQFLTYEIMSRLAGRKKIGGPNFFGFYLLIGFVALLPWTAWAIAGVGGAIRRRREDRVYLLLLLWLLIPWLFLECLRPKPPNYILPCCVPLAIMAAAEMVRRWQQPAQTAESNADKAIRRGVYWPMVGMAGLIVIGGLWQWRQAWGLAAAIAGAIMLVGFVVAAQLAIKRKQRAACAATIATLVATHVAFGAIFFPTLEPHRFSRNVAEAMNATIQPGDRVLLAGYKEPTLYVYLHQPVETIAPECVAEALRTRDPKQPLVLAVALGEVARLDKSAKDYILRVVKSGQLIEGFNHIKMRSVKVQIVRLEGARAAKSPPAR